MLVHRIWDHSRLAGSSRHQTPYPCWAVLEVSSASAALAVIVVVAVVTDYAFATALLDDWIRHALPSYVLDLHRGSEGGLVRANLHLRRGCKWLKSLQHPL
jgi:hypothetical protein